MIHQYRLYGVHVQSSVPFSDLDDVASTSGSPSAALCTVSLSRGAVVVPHRSPDHQFCHTGKLEGRVWLERYDERSSSVLVFPGLLRARLGPGAAITIDALPGVEEASAEHLVLDNVIPLALVRRGFTVLHGGAVQLPSGRCVAFLGASGAGKSTLVTSLNLAGLGLITDDCVVIRDPAGERQLAIGHRRSRLLETSIELLDTTSTGPVAALTSKRWVPAAGAVDERSLRLDAVVSLVGPGIGPRRPDQGTVRQLRAAAGLVEMVRHSFHRPHDRHAAAQGFSDLASLARGIPTYEISVGHGTSGLADVLSLLIHADRQASTVSGFQVDVGPVVTDIGTAIDISAGAQELVSR